MTVARALDRNNLLPGFPVCQGLEPDAQGHAGLAGCGLVPLPFAARNPDVYTHAGGVFDGGPTPRFLGLVHGLIMYSQKRLDKLPEWVLNVLTVNQEPQMTETKRNDYFWNILIRKAAEGDRAAMNVLDMIDENAVDPYDNYRLIELYDAGKES